ncbi:hypothetical protein [Nocardia sp. SYP-A9097]|uniref:hypothetical protein n=1 Tax=Nocardia sp. SYP-A9097 TaxID=2663237 RepID=UPI00129A5149|nr:hypothetical protein [Nocardia sp. SYP-A9097]
MRRKLGDATAVLLGILLGCLIVAAAIGALLYLLRDSRADETWDGEVPFVVTCSPDSPCHLTSVPDQTPTLALKGKPSTTINSPLPPELAGVHAGDHVLCTVHVVVFAWDRSVNDLESETTVNNCRPSQ